MRIKALITALLLGVAMLFAFKTPITPPGDFCPDKCQIGQIAKGTCSIGCHITDTTAVFQQSVLEVTLAPPKDSVVKVQCTSTTKTGRQCTRKCQADKKVCWQHDNTLQCGIPTKSDTPCARHVTIQGQHCFQHTTNPPTTPVAILP